ncbi:bifunctional diguanylate cyclase/phosphodiesterase [Acidovorax sp. Leaf160]|uniref:putative bifunctional diguanylate cyclase/phosphodiesterase n=1 Tax=Acidovorax sp. Leaf160 TaxID=1736280 RepID=UPI0006F46551|nr:bifunctional diguanylate cyclase/phosphodiesterase [Acidovorax sp. Leaf160]KQR42867.1 hypothetical protein ASF94_12235 [Acidovorax sp. Leaf160]
MESPLVTAYLISVGFLLMGAGYSVVLARHSTQPRLQWSYGVLCVLFALFQMGNALQYAAPDTAAALQAHRWLNLWSLLVPPVIVYLFELLGTRRPRLRLTGAAAAVTLVLVVHNFTADYGYRFNQLASDRLVTLPWGESIRLLSGSADMPYQLLRVLTLGLMAAALPGLRPGDTVRPDRAHWRWLPWVGMGLMATSAMLALLSDTGALSLPYVSGFAFLVMSVGFLWVVMEDLGRLHSRVRSRRRRAHGGSVAPAPQPQDQPLTPRARPAAQQQQQPQPQPQPAQAAAPQNPPALQPAARLARRAPDAEDTRFSGLSDRAGLLRQLTPVLDEHQRNAASLAVFVFDIDRFDLLCATHGHAAGDALLAQLAGRLQQAVQGQGLLARGHGASFVVVCTGIAPQAVAQRYAQLDNAFALPVAVSGKVLNVRASAGVARFPGDGVTAEAVVNAAELALHDAKSTGRSGGPLKTFTPALKDHLQEQMELEDALSHALERREFLLHYQPQVNGETGQVACMEALVRWQHPARGLVSPLRFISLAESSGVIHALGAWVLNEACRQLAAWHQQGHAGLRMAVNLSAHQLEDEGLETLITDTLARHRLRPADLELEITESVLMPQIERASERLAALRALGVRLSIDDFGTGYSSLTYLRRLPVHAFKLDRSFIRDVDLSGRGQAVCATAIGLAFDLGLEIVAEGVETVQQAQLLKHWGCHLLQGYLFARPMAAEAAGAFLVSTATQPDEPVQAAPAAPAEPLVVPLQMAPAA